MRLQEFNFLSSKSAVEDITDILRQEKARHQALRLTELTMAVDETKIVALRDPQNSIPLNKQLD
jgi:hypothetical protein